MNLLLGLFFVNSAYMLYEKWQFSKEQFACTLLDIRRIFLM